MMKKLPLIRQSTRMAYKQCPRKVYWSTVAGVRPKGTGLALLIRTAFHRGVELLRTGVGIQEAVKQAQQELQLAMDDPRYTDDDIEDEGARLMAYLTGYVVAYPNDKGVDWKAEVELKTATEKGTIDAVYTNEYGEVVIVDDKTRSRMTKDLALIVSLDEQLLNYRSLLFKANKVLASSASIREMKKAGIKRTKKEDASQYAQRVLELYCENPQDHYQEAFVDFDSNRFKNFNKLKGVENRKLKKMLADQKPVGEWPWNYYECSGKYGNCSYLNLCNGITDPTQKIYKPTEEGCLDDGKEYTRIFGFNPINNSKEEKNDYSSPIV